MISRCTAYPACLTGAPAWILASLLLLVSCSQPEVAKTPVPITPPEDRSTAPVTRIPLPEAPVVTPPSPPEVIVPAPAIVLPPGAVYVCLTESAGKQQQTVIEFSSKKVLDLCRRHPEMGPCQYERELCRQGGGRVFAEGGTEITQAIEDEYDKKVMRVRFRASDPTPVPARKRP